MKAKLRRPSPALVVACVALFVALGPAAYASHLVVTTTDIVDGEVRSPDLRDFGVTNVDLGANSVGTGKIINGAVTNPKLGANSVDSGKVVDGSMTGADVDESTLDQVPSAANADTLDGIDSSGFYAAGTKVADSEALDGLDSTAFVRGGGHILSGASAIGPTEPNYQIFLEDPGIFFLSYRCPATFTNNGFIRIRNRSASVMNLFTDSGGGNPNYFQLGPEQATELPAAASGDSFSFQFQGAFGIASAVAATVHRTSDCHAQGIVVLR